jgi:hypothetical protein
MMPFLSRPGTLMKIVLASLFLLAAAMSGAAAETLNRQKALEAAAELHKKNMIVAGMLVQARDAPSNQRTDTYRTGVLVLVDASASFQAKWSADMLAATSATPPRLSELNSFSACLWLANALTEASFELAESRQWKDRVSEAIAEHTRTCDAALGLPPAAE